MNLDMPSGLTDAPVWQSGKPKATRLSVVLVNGKLRAIPPTGTGHRVTVEFDGEDVLTMGCVQITLDAWAELMKQVEAAMARGCVAY